MIDKKSLKAVNEWVESEGELVLQERCFDDSWRDYKGDGVSLDDDYRYRIKPKEPREFWLWRDNPYAQYIVLAAYSGRPENECIKVREVIE